MAAHARRHQNAAWPTRDAATSTWTAELTADARTGHKDGGSDHDADGEGARVPGLAHERLLKVRECLAARLLGARLRERIARRAWSAGQQELPLLGRQLSGDGAAGRAAERDRPVAKARAVARANSPEALETLPLQR